MTAPDGMRSRLAVGLSRRPRPDFAGCVASLLIDGEPIETAVIGEALRYADGRGTLLPEEDRVPMTADTVFDLASLTKLFVAVTMMSLWDDGMFDLDRPIGLYLRGLNALQAHGVTVRMLLCHTAGFPDDFGTEPLPHDEPEFVSRLTRLPMLFQPGRGHSYSCIGYVLAGIIAQQLTGLDLATLIQDKVLTPLSLENTGYQPSARLQARCAATEDESYIGRGMVRGEVHDELAWALGGISGNAGIFGTVRDVARFGETIRQGGALHGKRIISERALAAMTREQVPASVTEGPYRQGIGFRLDDPALGAALAGSGSIGHTGFTGTSLVIDREQGIVLVILSNRVHPNRRWADLTSIRSMLGDYAADLARESA